MNAVTEQKPGEGMEIFFHPEIDHPQVDMSWCLNKDTLEKVVRDQLSGWKYHILIVSKHQTDRGTFEHRQLIRDVRLGFSYFTFYKPGHHDVSAYLFKFRSSDRAGWKEAGNLMKKDGRPGSYQSSVHVDTNDRYDASDWERAKGWFPGYNLALVEMYGMEVEIPESIFANEPAQWMKDWVYLWSRYGPEDQCDFRRRAIFAFTLQPVFFVIWELMKRIGIVVTGIFALLWGRISFLSIIGLAFTPRLRYEFPDVEISDHFEKSENVPIFWQGRFGRFFGPLAILSYGTLWYAAYSNQPLLAAAWASYGGLVTAILMWVAGIALFIGILAFAFAQTNKALERMLGKMLSQMGEGIKAWNDGNAAKSRARKNARFRDAEERKEARVADNLDQVRPYLGCGTAPSFDLARIESAPARKSIALQFQALKKSVCKPFVS